MIEQAWPKMEALKPNVLSIFESQTTVMQVAQGQADIAGMFYSKCVYPYTVQGAPVDMCYPREGTFAGINCVTLVKNAPERELAVAFINRMLDPGMQKLLAEATLTAPSISGLEFKPDIAKYLAYPEAKMDEMGIFSPRLGLHQSDAVETHRKVQSGFRRLRRDMAASVRLRELTKLFGATRAVDRVTLAIEPGSMVALLGPSGCGKTTTLRMIAGLLAAEAGEILIDDKPITRIPVHRRNIGMLFQNYALFPHMTVAREHRLRSGDPRRPARGGSGSGGRGPAACAAWRFWQPHAGPVVRRTAAACGAGAGAGGQPAVLLLDEPLGALDKSLRQSMQVELRDLQRRLGITTVMVTHDQDEALTMADRIAIMRDGHLEQTGTPAEVYLRPVSRFIASFLGAANFFRGRVERSADQSSLVAVPGGPTISVPVSRSIGSWVTVALRPELIKVRSPAAANVEAGVNEVHAVVEKVVYHGFVSHLYLRCRNGDALIAFRQNEASASGPGIDPGTRVCAFWPEESNHVVRDEAAVVSSEAAAE